MKSHLLELPVIPMPNSEEAPPAEAVSAHAKELWAGKGCPVGQTASLWLQSEQELLELQRKNHCNIGLAIHA
jgi:hypothetical protein